MGLNRRGGGGLNRALMTYAFHDFCMALIMEQKTDKITVHVLGNIVAIWLSNCLLYIRLIWFVFMEQTVY